MNGRGAPLTAPVIINATTRIAVANSLIDPFPWMRCRILRREEDILHARMNRRNDACASAVWVSILIMIAFGSPACLSRAAALEVLPWTPLRDAAPPSVFAETARMQVRIYVLSPQSGPAGTPVTVTGFGFTNDNAIHFGNRVVTHVMVKSTFGVSCTVAPKLSRRSAPVARLQGSRCATRRV